MKEIRGFTVVELLVVTAILTFIIGGMTIALQQQQRQFNITKEATDIDQTGRSVLDFIASEIRNSASRQGKSFSLDFINGGRENCTNNTTDSGTKDSPPDCLTIFTWDIDRGMTDGTVLGSVNLPSIATEVEINSVAGGLVLNLPDSWFDGSNFIGTNESNPTILLGARSRTTLCNTNPSINCLSTPEKCTECAIVLEGDVNGSTKTISFDATTDIVKTNFPTDVTFSSMSEFINGATSAAGVTYGFVPTISSQASEMAIVESKAFRVDPIERELQMSNNGGAFQPIAGGQQDTPTGLEAPGIVDLQFVFTLQNPDGSVAKVGFCDGANCNSTTDLIFNDFEVNSGTPLNDDYCCIGRELDIRSVEIYLVVKSKIRPRKLRGGLFEQEIPEIADVAERDVSTNQSNLKEPEEGFIYRIHSTTIYPRNMAREEFG